MPEYKLIHTGPKIDEGISRALPGGALDVAVGALEAALAGKANLSNKNLLVNAWFDAPYVVNQRGQSSYSGAKDYCIDRWYRYDNATVTVNSGYLTLASASLDSYLFQRLEHLQSGPYALSINIDGEVKYTTLTWNGSTRVQTLLSFGVKSVVLGLTVDAGFPTFFVLPNAVASYDIYAAKLELGPTSTLHIDAKPSPAEQELNRQVCKGYYRL